MTRSFWQAFWRLAAPYWRSDDRWTGRGLFAAIVALNLAIVWVNVRLNAWNGDFYNALQDKRFDDFKRLLIEFCGWAFLYIVLVVYQLYLNQMLLMRWRRWLTDVHLKAWLADAVHYRLSLADFGTDNPDQRIAEDFRDFVSESLSLFFGLLSSVVSFLSFVGILWGLSGAATVGDWTIPGYLVWVAIAYAAVGSWIAHRIGKPLVGLNFAQQRYEADFRFALVRARENAEGIALYRGEQGELAGFRHRFGNLVGNWWQIMKRQKRFTWFSSFYGQMAVVFPILVASPRYFSGAIQLGGLTQIASAFGEVQRALSWLVDAYVRVAGWRASVERLIGFVDAVDAARRLGGRLSGEQGDAIGLGEVTVGVPERGADGTLSTRALIRASGQRIAPGEHTLIAGPSGCGKSTLFRMLSGIWPFGEGRYLAPAPTQALFLPQKPYLPLGPLREVVSYPARPGAHDDRALGDVLACVGLPGLAERLGEDANWSQVLSGGEQQRLAIARALLHAPRWLFLDEATSALDESSEAALYAALRDRLTGTTLVSIAHRASVARYHGQRLIVVPGAGQPAGLRIEAITAS
jgi:putative ATP-binding cassette transporter